jgi:putative ribosome biogenesis GTPase RsgA
LFVPLSRLDQSCNADFNPSRLERYLAVAFEAQVTPVIVLSKADLCNDPQSYIAAAQGASPDVAVMAVNGTDSADSLASLRPWLGAGQTVAFVGSSDVGKSTLVNALLGASRQETHEIRQADDKGRHTTTARYRMESYLKLVREAERAASPAWRRRQEQRQFGRIARAAQKQRRKDTGRD